MGVVEVIWVQQAAISSLRQANRKCAHVPTCARQNGMQTARAAQGLVAASECLPFRRAEGGLRNFGQRCSLTMMMPCTARTHGWTCRASLCPRGRDVHAVLRVLCARLVDCSLHAGVCRAASPYALLRYAWFSASLRSRGMGKEHADNLLGGSSAKNANKSRKASREHLCQ